MDKFNENRKKLILQSVSKHGANDFSWKKKS